MILFLKTVLAIINIIIGILINQDKIDDIAIEIVLMLVQFINLILICLI